MTVVENTENTIDVFENDIDLYINLFCEENKIDNICSISQSVFNGIMLYIYRHCFKNTNKLKNKNDLFNVGLGGTSNCNSYNITLVSELADYYIYLCRKYDKEISLTGFSYLTGIEKETFYAWRDERGKIASSEYSKVFKKLNSGREDSLSDKLVTGKVNPVGILGVLNHNFNWAGVGNMTEDKAIRAGSLGDVRKNVSLLSDNSGGDSMQLDQKPQLELSDNLTQLENQ